MSTVATSTRAKKRHAASPPPASPPIMADPVTRYARAVLEGAVVAGRAVVLACERHLRDLDRQRTDTFPYYFDAGAAEHVIAFFPTFLTLEDGARFVLTDWLQFCLGSIFGWKHAVTRLRRYQIGYIETGKGSGKTPTLAGVGLYCLAFDDEPSAEIYSAAFDKGQAGIILNDAIRMAEASADLRDVLDIGKYNIAHPSSGSFFRAVSSEHRSKSGPRPSTVLVDELHEHRDATVVNKMRAGFKFRRQPLLIEITNSGHDRTSVCWQHHDHSLKVLEGIEVDEHWFAYVCQLDPCEACFADGYRQPKQGCEHCDNWTNPAVWPKANPSLYVILQPSYLQTQVDLAIAMPSDRALVERLNFCIWTVSHQLWIPPDDWNACARPSVANVGGGRACTAGFDMSEKLDLTACVIALRVDDAPNEQADTVELIDQQNGEEVVKTLNLDFSVELIPFFWMPEDTLIKRVSQERVPFDVWRGASALRVTPGPVVDQNLIYDEFVTDIGKRYRPQRVGYDAHNATTFMVQLRDKAKYTVVDVPQGRALSESFKLFEILVRLKRIRHAGNPVMGWCVSNAEPKRDRYENLWLEKPSATKRIDGVIAAVMALSQLVLSGPTESVYKKRGVLVL